MSTANSNSPVSADQLAYDQYQCDMTAYLIDAFGKRTDYETVLSAMIALWSKNDFNLLDPKQETLLCAVHGWTLAEFLDVHCSTVEANA